MRGYKPLSYLLLCISLPFQLLAREPISIAKAEHFQKTAPLAFLENKGQVRDQDNNPRTDIQYKIATPGLNVFIGNGQIHYQFFKENKSAIEHTSFSAHRVDVSLIGANTNAPVITSGKQSYYNNYYNIANGKEVNDLVVANTYDKITYKDIYPNIDWVLYTANGTVEYDFVVRPGGNVADIKIKYDGVSTLSSKDGGIVATTPMGMINEKKPVAYELMSNKKIASSFSLKDNTISFNTASFSGTLVIDPVLVWGTYYGGTTGEFGNAVAYDVNGYVYLAGAASSSANVATTGAQSTTLNGSTDAFLVKFDTLGVRQWATYYGGPSGGSGSANGNDEGRAVAVDASGNVFLAGNTFSASGINTLTGGFGNGYRGTGDGFLVKFNSSGARQWGRYVGGSAADVINGIAIEPSGDPIVVGGTQTCSGFTNGCGGIASNGAFQGTWGGNQDAFIIRYNANTAGTYWGTYYGGTGNDVANSIFCSGGTIYVAGSTTTTSSVFATSGVYQSTNMGGTVGYDGFVAGFTLNGNRLWGTYLGGAGDDFVYGVTVDATGNVYVTGETSSTADIATAGSFQTTNSGTNGFLMKLASGGTALTWGTYFGDMESSGRSLITDAGQSVYVTGHAEGTKGIATANAINPTNAGGEDAFLMRFNSNGVLKYGTYFGGTQTDFGTGFATDASGNIYISGTTSSTTGIATTGSFLSTYPSTATQSAFLIKVAPDTFATITRSADTFLCPGSYLTVQFITNKHYNVGDTFYAQLSDATGDFSSGPTNIGYAVRTTSGTISAQIPANQFPSNKYRIRVVATNPEDTATDNGKDITIDTLHKPVIVSNDSICVGETLNIVAGINNPPGTSVNWTTPQSLAVTVPVITIPNAQLTDDGQYTITVSLNGCHASTSVNSHIFGYPSPAVITYSSNPACTGKTVFFNATGDVGATFEWNGPNSLYVNGATHTIMSAALADSGNYVVTTTLNGCSTTDSSTLVVRISPTAPTATINSGICAGDTLKLSANSPTPNVTYSWTPAFAGSNQQNAVIPNAPACGFCGYVATVTLRGCSASSPYTPAVVNPPVSAATVIISSTSDTICGGSSITYTATAGPAGAINPLIYYEWRVNGVAVPGQSGTGSGFDSYTTNSLADGDLVSCYVKETVSCQTIDNATSNFKLVHVINRIMPTITVTTYTHSLKSDTTVTYTAIVSNGNANGLSFQWLKNGNPIAGATSSTYSTNTLTAGDVISVIVNSNVACTLPNTITVYGNTVEVPFLQNAIGNVMLYPSPNHGNFMVTGNIPNTNSVTIEVLNALGQIVYRQDAAIQHDKLSESINMTHVAAGVYIVRISAGNDSRMMKFIID